MSPKVSIPSSSSTTAGLNSSSDYRTCKEHIRTEGSPTTEAGKEMDRCVSEVKEERSEVKDTKIKDKEEVNEVVDAKVKEEVNEKIDPVKGEDRDDENVDVTNNLIKQIEKLVGPLFLSMLETFNNSPSPSPLQKIVWIVYKGVTILTEALDDAKLEYDQINQCHVLKVKVVLGQL